MGQSWKQGRFSGRDFTLQPDGTLRCPSEQTLVAYERRREADGSLRVVFGASIRSCRPCPLRDQCQWQGRTTAKPRQVSVLLHPLLVASAPILWRDWSRRRQRRACASCAISWWRSRWGLAASTNRPQRRLHCSLVQSVPIGGYPGPNDWRAMPAQEQLIRSRSACSASQPPLLPRSGWRRSESCWGSPVFLFLEAACCSEERPMAALAGLSAVAFMCYPSQLISYRL